MAEETGSKRPSRISWVQMIVNQGVVTQAMLDYEYAGNGTEEDPYLVEWLKDDPRNPLNFPYWLKMVMSQTLSIATLAVAFVSSAYTGGISEISIEFNSSFEVVALGISLFVLGFAIGPLAWAPLSELYGRQIFFFGTYAGLTFFNAGAAGSQNIWTLIILRFLAGAIGSSPLTNAGGVIADMFSASERGIATTMFAAAPFLGPVLGPIVGGFAGESIGWRWVEGIVAIFTGVMWIVASMVVPETYAPVLLRRRAETLSKITGKVYKSRADVVQGRTVASQAFKRAMGRPWKLLFREPIVFLLSIYVAIIYGTLYLLFAAYPIVYQQTRGWSAGVGSLPFLGIMVGMFIAVAYSFWDNNRYVRLVKNEPSGMAPPEARLPPAAVGAISIPVGLFWFAWTNGPETPWPASVCAGIPFGFGMLLLFLGLMNYLVDAYTIYAASALAANALLRSLFGAVFPLFTSYMYQDLGIHWASSIPAFLALVCVPFPFLLYKFGPAIRKRCKYAAEADNFMKKMREQAKAQNQPGSGNQSRPSEDDDEPTGEKRDYSKAEHKEEA